MAIKFALQNGALVYRMVAVRGRIFRWLLILALLTVAGGAAWLWWRVDTQARRLLLPNNPLYSGYNDLPDKAQGVSLEPFELTGWDGTPVQACIVRKPKESEGLTPRQQSLRERLSEELSGVDYALVCVDWDHGIRSALPLAEALAAAGITCVLWEPRGSSSARNFCTHGLHESADVPLIINELEKRTGHGNLIIAGIGRGFGAELMLQAAAVEPRLHAIVAIDAASSLNKTLKRANVSAPMRELIGLRMNQLTGLEPFDIAAVKSASLISRELPVLVAHTGAELPAGSLEDAAAIYTQLRSDQRRLLTVRNAKDAPEATTRTITHSTAGGKREIVQEIEADLANNADEVLVEVLRWLSNVLISQEESQGLLPTRYTP